MAPLPSRPDDAPDPDPATAIKNYTTMRLPAAQEEWALIRYVGSPIGEVVLLQEEEIFLGRSSECRICLQELEVSRKHARVALRRPDEYTTVVEVQDLGSTNGTFVNGRRLGPGSSPAVLREGDVLRVGAHAFKLKRLDALERHYHDTVMTQTTVDPLTGVSNRATVLHYLEKHAELARRHQRPLSLILADLDHFKAVNDRHGHPTGDLVLQLFGVVLLGRLRASDHVGRIGGEEFLVVLPETAAKEALTVAENLRLALERELVGPLDGGDPFQVTCSLGVAQLSEQDLDGGSLLARADVALYKAKSGGRNRVAIDTGP